MSWLIDKNNLAFVPSDSSQHFSDANLIPVTIDSEANQQANAIISAKERSELYSKYTSLVGNAFVYLNKVLSDVSKLPIRRVPYTGGSSFLTGCGGDTGDKCEAYVPGKEDQSIPVSCYADLDGDGHSNGDEADSPDGIIDTNIPTETNNPEESSNPNETTNPEVITAPDDQDGDGSKVCVAPGDNLKQICDCDDNNASINPESPQIINGNGKDTDCNGSTEIDPQEDVVIFVGEEGGFSAGRQVAKADVTGDGKVDVIISADYSTGEWPDGWNGRIYIFDGALNIFELGTVLRLADADTIITGGTDTVANATQPTGWNIGGTMLVVDVNNDGIKDIITTVGSRGPSFEAGAIGVLFGRNNWPARLDMHGLDLWNAAALRDKNMALIKGPRPNERPNGLDSDAAMGFNWRLAEYSPEKKEPTLLAGHTNGFDGQTTTDVLPLRGLEAGVMIAYHDLVTHQIHGSIDSETGAVGSVDINDANGDGKGDIIVGNYREFPSSEDNVVFIKSNAAPLPKQLHVDRLADTPSIDWFKFTCLSNRDSLGSQVRMADVDGDGRADLIFTDSTMKTYNANGSVLYESVLYVLPALQTGLAATGNHPSGIVINKGTNLSVITDFPQLGGYQIFGDSNPTGLGFTTNESLIPTDMNGDGVAELLVSAPDHPTVQNFFFDFARMTPGAYTTSQAQQTLPWDFHASVYSAAGDINGDGANDLLIGAPTMKDPSNPNQQSAAEVGGAYLLFGGR